MINNKPGGDRCLLGLPGSASCLPGSQGGPFLLYWTQACHNRTSNAIWPRPPILRGPGVYTCDVLQDKVSMVVYVLKKHSSMEYKHLIYAVICITMLGHLSIFNIGNLKQNKTKNTQEVA